MNPSNLFRAAAIISFSGCSMRSRACSLRISNEAKNTSNPRNSLARARELTTRVRSITTTQGFFCSAGAALATLLSACDPSGRPGKSSLSRFNLSACTTRTGSRMCSGSYMIRSPACSQLQSEPKSGERRSLFRIRSKSQPTLFQAAPEGWWIQVTHATAHILDSVPATGGADATA